MFLNDAAWQWHLTRAGFQPEQTWGLFQGLRGMALAGGITLAVAAVVLQALLQVDLPLLPWYDWVVLGVAGGLFLPYLLLVGLAHVRRLRRRRHWPDVVRWLQVLLEGQFAFDAALRRICQDLRERPELLHANDLRDDLEAAVFNLQMGEKRSVLRELGQRSGLEELQLFAALLVQADRCGRPVRWAVATYAALLERRRPGRLWWLETGVPLAAAVAAVLAFALPWWGQVLAFGAAVAAWYWARPWRAGAMYRARCKAYMPDALAVIACGLKAGHTPAACIQTAAEELPEPLGGAFHWVLQAHRNGATLEDALQLLGRHVPVLDLHQFITLATQSRLSPPDLGEALERLGPGPRE